MCEEGFNTGGRVWPPLVGLHSHMEAVGCLCWLGRLGLSSHPPHLLLFWQSDRFSPFWRQKACVQSDSETVNPTPDWHTRAARNAKWSHLLVWAHKNNNKGLDPGHGIGERNHLTVQVKDKYQKKIGWQWGWESHNMQSLDNGVCMSLSSCLLTGQVQSCIELHHSNWKKDLRWGREKKEPLFSAPSAEESGLLSSHDVGAKGTEGGIQTPSSPAPMGWEQRNPC